MYTPPITPNIPGAQGLGNEELTGGQVFAAGLKEGLNASLIAVLARSGGGPRVLTGIPELDAPRGFESALAKPISEDEWAISPQWREGLKYEPGMTDYRAKLLADNADRLTHNAWVDEHWSGPLKGTIKTLGQIAGGLLDPTNYIPLLGEAALAARVIHGVYPVGKVAAGALTGAAINAGVVGTAQVIDAVNASELQQDPDWRGAALNTGVAALFGAGLGALSGFFSRVPLEQRITATAKALDDLSAGRPVDVAPVLERQDLAAPVGEAQPKADFSVAQPKETPIPELAQAQRAPGAAQAGQVDIGVTPEKMAEVTARFSDLEANPATKYLTEAADVTQETKSLTDRAKAFRAAALCLAREIF
jgi:hypothetical protein